MRIVSFLLLLMAGIYSHGGWAETCKGDIGQMTVNVQNIKYLPTLPLNTQMTSVMAPPAPEDLPSPDPAADAAGALALEQEAARLRAAIRALPPA